MHDTVMKQTICYNTAIGSSKCRIEMWVRHSRCGTTLIEAAARQFMSRKNNNVVFETSGSGKIYVLCLMRTSASLL